MFDVKTATTKELVEYYNENSDKSVKKFANRTTAERRVTELIEEMDTRMPDTFGTDEPAKKKTADERKADKAELKLKSGAKLSPKALADLTKADQKIAARNDGRVYCPGCGIHLSNGSTEHSEKTPNAERQFRCMACDAEYGRVVRRASSGNASEGIAKSWKDPEVYRKRIQRSAVVVDGERYKSVSEAFRVLDLPMKVMIGFRMELKAKKRLTAFEHKWKIVPLNYED